MDRSETQRLMGEGKACVYCGETFSEFDADWPRKRLNPETEQHMHTACLSRAVLGSVGHLRGLCSCYGGTMEDPPGLSRREAALAAYYEGFLEAKDYYRLLMDEKDYLEQYVIYDHPEDYPDAFVVRLWHVRATSKGGIVPTALIRTAQTLEEARSHIPAGLVRMPRWKEDEPQIVETWF